MDVAVAPLPFGDSYWDYLPDLVQDKIFKMVHKQLLKSVNSQIQQLLICPICSRYFEVFEELKYHWDLYSHPKERFLCKHYPIGGTPLACMSNHVFSRDSFQSLPEREPNRVGTAKFSLGQSS